MIYVLAAIVAAVVGWFVTGAVALWIAGLCGMSDFEGGRGMFAFLAVGPVGGLIAMIVSAWLVLRFGRAAVPLGRTFVHLALVLGATDAALPLAAVTRPALDRDPGGMAPRRPHRYAGRRAAAHRPGGRSRRAALSRPARRRRLIPAPAAPCTPGTPRARNDGDGRPQGPPLHGVYSERTGRLPGQIQFASDRRRFDRLQTPVLPHQKVGRDRRAAGRSGT